LFVIICRVVTTHLGSSGGAGNSLLFVVSGARRHSLVVVLSACRFSCVCSHSFVVVVVHSSLSLSIRCHPSSVVGCHITDGDVAPASCVKKKIGRGRTVIYLDSDNVAHPLTCQVIVLHSSSPFICLLLLPVVNYHTVDGEVAPCFLCEKKE
jgi:hypothetical protein